MVPAGPIERRLGLQPQVIMGGNSSHTEKNGWAGFLPVFTVGCKWAGVNCKGINNNSHVSLSQFHGNPFQGVLAREYTEVFAIPFFWGQPGTVQQWGIKFPISGSATRAFQHLKPTQALQEVALGVLVQGTGRKVTALSQQRARKQQKRKRAVFSGSTSGSAPCKRFQQATIER